MFDYRVIGYVFPGQGAQRPAMLEPWLTDPHSAEWAHEFSSVLDFNLLDAGTVWDAERIADTAITQPLLVACALLSYQAGISSQLADMSDGVPPHWPSPTERLAPGPIKACASGHSVGELAAAAAVGILSPLDAVYLAGKRGAAMAQAAAASPTSMAAVVGKIDRTTLTEHLHSIGLQVANENSSTQVVVAGASEAIAELIANPPRGLRVIKLKVAGAFHTSAMAPAQAELAQAMTTVKIHDPHTTIISNADGQPVPSGQDFCQSLVAQITRPVRWQACMETMRDALAVQSTVELAPAGVLSGLIKRELKIPVIQWNTPDDLSLQTKDDNAR